MLLYLFFDSSLSTCPKKMETEKWPKASDSPLYYWCCKQQKALSTAETTVFFCSLKPNVCSPLKKKALAHPERSG